MTDTRPLRSSPPSRGTWIGICVLLTPAVVLPLLVWLYDKEDPTLFGFPFYFWFQFALIPVVSALTYLAFRISLWATEKDRPAFGLPAEDDPQKRGNDD